MSYGNSFAPKKICICKPPNTSQQQIPLDWNVSKFLPKNPIVNPVQTHSISQPNYCDQCGQSFVVECPTCHGDGGFPCSICQGIKVGSCPTCKGSRTMRLENHVCPYTNWRLQQSVNGLYSRGNEALNDAMYCNCHRIQSTPNPTIRYNNGGVWREPIADIPIKPASPPIKLDLRSEQFPGQAGKGLNYQPQARFCSNCGVQLVKKCETCGGNGYEICQTCHKRKRWNCSDCHGTREVFNLQAVHKFPCQKPSIDLKQSRWAW